ncbi:hypothetical protein A2U01_0006986 [Trifolium medium]|uniref:Uncharacterized protein n=1 Tax=Trifolium medium TaxID=97028 RepID=A0A392MF68_9FABA|nr:hypothetical protein [Trifolium medium]
MIGEATGSVADSTQSKDETSLDAASPYGAAPDSRSAK